MLLEEFVSNFVHGFPILVTLFDNCSNTFVIMAKVICQILKIHEKKVKVITLMPTTGPIH